MAPRYPASHEKCVVARQHPMKRWIGMAIANWFRKPENREKAKRTANSLLNKNRKRDNSPVPNKR